MMAFELDLCTPGERLEGRRDLDLKVHFRLSPGCGGWDLLGKSGRAVADDLIEGFALCGRCGSIRHAGTGTAYQRAASRCDNSRFDYRFPHSAQGCEEHEWRVAFFEGKPPELLPARLIWMEFQSKLPQPFP